MAPKVSHNTEKYYLNRFHIEWVVLKSSKNFLYPIYHNPSDSPAIIGANRFPLCQQVQELNLAFVFLVLPVNLQNLSLDSSQPQLKRLEHCQVPRWEREKSFLISLVFPQKIDYHRRDDQDEKSNKDRRPHFKWDLWTLARYKLAQYLQGCRLITNGPLRVWVYWKPSLGPRRQGWQNIEIIGIIISSH